MKNEKALAGAKGGLGYGTAKNFVIIMIKKILSLIEFSFDIYHA
jgi:hypothetical protein